MREVGRLREMAFRAVGEGSGNRRDTDIYDKHYIHLLLWDESELEIAGAYRFCDASKALSTNGESTNGESANGEPAKGEQVLYSASLFKYRDSMNTYLAQGLELGRSFVQPQYRGKRSLEYLWYGIGAVLSKNPQYRYLFGPVTLSNSYAQHAKDMLVHFLWQIPTCDRPSCNYFLPDQDVHQAFELQIRTPIHSTMALLY